MSENQTPTPSVPVSNFIENNRLIYLGGNIEEPKAEAIVCKLIQYECRAPGKDIILYIDSYGGMVDSFIAIHDTIRSINSPVSTICIGKAMSCGALLLMSGTPGRRFITPNSRVCIHEISMFTGGKLAETETDVKEMKRQQVQLEKIILRYTKIDNTKLAKMMLKDTYFSATEALKNGIVDHVITSPGIVGRYIKS